MAFPAPAAPSPPPRAVRDYAPLARRVVAVARVLGVLAGIGSWSWHQPFMAYPRAVAELSGLPAPASLPVPVEGVEAGDVADTWGAPRGADRQHQGVDIFAPRGTPVRSTTRGVVTAVRDTGLGGRQVWVLGPGGERHYYAHLDDWTLGLARGDRVRPGSLLGFVGTTGNARGTPPHLHYGIYAADGATDPLPRLRANPGPDATGAAPEAGAGDGSAPKR
jgi:murein DD-endopeptidase MepM/ murein hydrolase activator NlpD